MRAFRWGPMHPIYKGINMNYGFKCPEDHCLNKLQIYIMTPMNQRPKCPTHHVHYVPDINWPSGVKIEETAITPQEAKDLLANAFTSSFEGVDEQIVDQYATLMATGEWIFITKQMGGEHYPIYLRDDKVLLGIQRLQACVKADVSFMTVMVNTYGYY